MLFYQEIFKSIQGESRDSGLPCTFIRLYGCSIGCSYCDQPQCKSDRKKISVDSILNKVKQLGAKYVCITGGEPLIQEEVYVVIYELLSMGYKVSIETSGCVPIEPVGYRRSYRYVMDIKCPSSKVSHKNVYENLISLQDNDEVKYVIATREDYDFMKKIMRSYPTSASILVSPMFNRDGTICDTCKDLVSWILEDNLDVRCQVQLHKVLNVK